MRCSVLISGDQADRAEFSLLFTESATEAELNTNNYVWCPPARFAMFRHCIWEHKRLYSLSLSPPLPQHPSTCTLRHSWPHETPLIPMPLCPSITANRVKDTQVVVLSCCFVLFLLLSELVSNLFVHCLGCNTAMFCIWDTTFFYSLSSRSCVKCRNEALPSG